MQAFLEGASTSKVKLTPWNRFASVRTMSTKILTGIVRTGEEGAVDLGDWVNRIRGLNVDAVRLKYDQIENPGETLGLAMMELRKLEVWVDAFYRSVDQEIK